MHALVVAVVAIATLLLFLVFRTNRREDSGEDPETSPVDSPRSPPPPANRKLTKVKIGDKYIRIDPDSKKIEADEPIWFIDLVEDKESASQLTVSSEEDVFRLFPKSSEFKGRLGVYWDGKKIAVSPLFGGLWTEQVKNSKKTLFYGPNFSGFMCSDGTVCDNPDVKSSLEILE
jgi:hypothetical protein